MPRIVPPLIALLATVLGLTGTWTDIQPIADHAPWLILFGGLSLGLLAPRASFLRTGTRWPRASDEARPLRLGLGDWLRAPVMWFHGYQRSYAVEPGLYFTGERYDLDAPLLVTSNYLLTVLALHRALAGRSVRLLVVDSDGINVWCAAGKGRFSAPVILAELNRYPKELWGPDDKPTIVLPKLGLAGVRLEELREAGLRPVIGPVHARDLPAYLDADRLKHRSKDRVHFGWAARCFCCLPGLVQYLGYALAILLALVGFEALGGPRPSLGLLAIVAWLGTAYPLLFPWIPGQRFAVKGLWLGGGTALALAACAALGLTSWAMLPATALFTLATAVYVGLSFTGNSAVSNYSAVRAEIARFGPFGVILFLASLTAYLLAGATP